MFKIHKGTRPEDRDRNINSFFQLLSYDKEHEQQQRSKSKSSVFNETVAPETLVNKAGVLERIYSISQLAIYVLAE